MRAKKEEFLELIEGYDKDSKGSIPEVLPDDLQECLQLFEKIKYGSRGFPLVFLDYNYTFKYWSIMFRNPVNFVNPEIKAETPLEAVHQMLDFLKEVEFLKKMIEALEGEQKKLEGMTTELVSLEQEIKKYKDTIEFCEQRLKKLNN